MADRFAKVKAAQTTKTASTTDTLGAVMTFFGKNIDKLKVGQGLEIDIPEDDVNKNGTFGMKTLGIARARLVSVTREGEPWAGQDYSVSIDRTTKPEKPCLIIMRNPDLATPRPKKTGGRKAGTPNKAKAGVPSLSEAMGMSKEHLNPGDNENDNNNEIKDVVVKDLT